ncbi:MAG: sporulation protein [Oscillospiraceae bacterium]|nr:sporulation protein [Oscillospiraceae bacterium]
MYIRKSKKIISASLAVLVMGSVICGRIMYNINAVEEAPKTIVSDLENSVKTQSETKEETVLMWKAVLSEYNSSFSIVDYETVEVEEETEAEEEKNEDEIIAGDSGEYDSTDYIESSGNTGVVDVPERPQYDPIDIESGNFGFTTYGYGHGVGLSQNGANHYATYAGWNYQQILQHYYPGTYISNSGTAEKETISAGGVSGSVLDIVSMVTYNEVGSSMSNEAIKAQAVAVYTYIKYKGGNASDLYPASNPPQNVVNAVKSVLGEAVCYDGRYALAMFCASSGGSTASCYDVFYEDIPYLRSVACDYDSQCDPHYGTVEVFSAGELKSILESNLGITLSDDPSNWVSIIEGDGGYAAYVVVDGQVTIKGNDFRYYLGLKSPKFECTYY